MGRFRLKATADDNSNAIIVSFDSKWYESLQAKNVSVVFRKTGPTKFLPHCMYMYLGRSISSIVARATIDSYERLPVDQAVCLAEQGCISKEELVDYVSQPYGGRYTELVVYRIGPVCMARSPITMRYLAAKYDYWPSTTYVRLSDEGKRTLNSIGNFEIV